MPHPAMDALRSKLRLIDFWRSDKGPGYAAALAETTRLRSPAAYTPSSVPKPGSDMTAYAGALARRLDFAATYWVDTHMVDLTVHAAESRPLDPIHVEDIPTQHGFAWFDRPAELTFVQPTGEFDTLTIKGFLWDQGMNDDGRPGISVIFWSDTTDRRDTLAALLADNKVNPFRHTGHLVVAHIAFIPYSESLPEQWWWAALPSTFFNLISQPITTTSAVAPDRVMRKQAERAKVLANTVAIITLRRQKPPPIDAPEPDLPEGQKRTLTVRSMVGERTGGFWRRQHYKDGVKPVWVNPFVRGPEGAPFVVRKDKIYAWKR